MFIQSSSHLVDLLDWPGSSDLTGVRGEDGLLIGGGDWPLSCSGWWRRMPGKPGGASPDRGPGGGWRIPAALMGWSGNAGRIPGLGFTTGLQCKNKKLWLNKHISLHEWSWGRLPCPHLIEKVHAKLKLKFLIGHWRRNHDGHVSLCNLVFRDFFGIHQNIVRSLCLLLDINPWSEIFLTTGVVTRISCGRWDTAVTVSSAGVSAAAITAIIFINFVLWIRIVDLNSHWFGVYFLWLAVFFSLFEREHFSA